MGMPNNLYQTTDATWGFLGAGVSQIGNMFAANNIYASQADYLEGQKELTDRQLQIDSERVNFEARLRADWIKHNAELDTMVTDMRISDAKRREDLIRQRAKSLLYAAGEQEKRLREQGRVVKGAQRAAIASSGLTGDSGTYEEAVRQTADRVEEDAGILRYNTQLAVFGVDMEASELTRERAAAEIYKSAAVRTADIDAKLTLLSGTAEANALKKRADITKLNIDTRKLEAKHQRNAALIGGLTELTDSMSKAWDSLRIIKKPIYN